MHLTRRHSLKLGGGLIGSSALSTTPLSATEVLDEPVLNEDGLYEQSWFLDSFLELNDDLTAAQENGKRFVIFWELKGCPYCKETHFVNFARPDIRAFIRSNFEILQLNIIGSRMVTDFDGEELSEKALAAKYAARFTPTLQFFPPSAEGLADLAPVKREIARLPGYLKPDHFLAMFKYVQAEAYTTTSFRKYLSAAS